jgi:hypothetical protein
MISSLVPTSGPSSDSGASVCKKDDCQQSDAAKKKRKEIGATMTLQRRRKMAR